jgi:hypothetical protein
MITQKSKTLLEVPNCFTPRMTSHQSSSDLVFGKKRSQLSEITESEADKNADEMSPI